MEYLRELFRPIALLYAVGWLALGAGALQASVISFTVDQGTSNGLATVLVDDEAEAGKITFTITVSPDPDDGNNIGDLLGLFFNVAPYPLTGLSSGDFAGTGLSHVTIGTGDDVHQDSSFGCNNVSAPGVPNFDVGVTFGECGASGGLVLSAILTMDSVYPNATLTAFSFENFGVRLQAVGAAPDSGGDSAKLFGENPVCISGCGPAPPQETPEPATLALVGVGLLVLARTARGRATMPASAGRKW